MVWLTDARAPEGLRLYAIGDVHGCLDELSAVHDAVGRDLAERPVDDWRVIHLGDYVDRGAESCAVLEFLIDRMAADERMICLRGNHDEMFARAVEGDRRSAELWLTNGGIETLHSYGLSLTDFLDELRSDRPMQDIVPASHRSFLDGLLDNVRFGDFYFVHAGIDPARPLDDQESRSQLWIREPFLSSRAEYEAVVVHGHTPVDRVDMRPNRIGIDTGAVFGGSLSCLVLEGSETVLLTGDQADPQIPSASENHYRDEDRGPGMLRRVFGGKLFGRR